MPRRSSMLVFTRSLGSESSRSMQFLRKRTISLPVRLAGPKTDSQALKVLSIAQLELILLMEEQYLMLTIKPAFILASRSQVLTWRPCLDSLSSRLGPAMVSKLVTSYGPPDIFLAELPKISRSQYHMIQRCSDTSLDLGVTATFPQNP